MKFSIGVRLGVMLAAFLLFLPACSSQSENPIQGPLNFLVQSLAVLLPVLTFTIIFKLLNGTINMRGLLLDKDTGTFSPARLQLLILTIATAATYLATDGMASLSKDEPNYLMELIMGGTNVIYLAAKGRPLLKKT